MPNGLDLCTTLLVRPGERFERGLCTDLGHGYTLNAYLVLRADGNYRVHSHILHRGDVSFVSQGRLHFTITGRPYFRKHGVRYYLADFSDAVF